MADDNWAGPRRSFTPPPTKFGTAATPSRAVQQKPVPHGPAGHGIAKKEPPGASALAPGFPAPLMVARPPAPPRPTPATAVQTKMNPVAPPRVKLAPQPPGPRVIQTATEDEVGYESLSDASDDELENLGARRGKTGVAKSAVYLAYLRNRQILRDIFKASRGFKRAKKELRDGHQSDVKTRITASVLANIVKTFDTGTPGANTHILVRLGDTVKLYQGNTATAVKLAIKKLKYNGVRISVDRSSMRSYKKKNLHTEMGIIYEATGGDVKKVPNCLMGRTITVDKACCRMCYYWMKLAKATVIDGTDFNAVLGKDRQSFDWTNPFDNKRFTKGEVGGKTDKWISDYVTSLTS